MTAFEPFGGAAWNGSLEAARRWALRDPAIRLAVLPVVAGAAERAARKALRACDPAPRRFFALGEAGPEPVVRLEKVAINWDDFRIPDNAGVQRRDVAIRRNGPAARFATLPVARIEAALDGRTRIPVRVSLSAGAFLCNHLAYQMLSQRLPCPFAFVHVPSWRPEHGPELLDDLVATLEALRDVCDTLDDPAGRGTLS